MDWHSSGITTSVLGALKRGLSPRAAELGVHVCGGRGRHSRKTPGELVALAERLGLDGEALASTSRLVAKVDSAAVQDGYELYLHGFIVSDEGHWTVVQQGMRGSAAKARRYHWLSEGLESFVDAPHSAIEGEAGGQIVNLTDARAARSRSAQIELLETLGPDGVARELAALEGRATPAQPAQMTLPHLTMPDHHDVRAADVVTARLRGNLAAAAARGPKDFTELLQAPGVGARTVRSLALVAEVMHGAPCRFTDPARFAFAHGGKDRHPFPVPIRVYDRTISVLKSAVRGARLGQADQLHALRRLDAESRRLEAAAGGASFEAILAEERANSASYGGRSVYGWETAPQEPRSPQTPLSPAKAGA
jgi:hypothetical protein